MKFDVRLPDSPAIWMIRAAGIHAGGLAEVWNDLAAFDRGQLPVTFTGEYFRTEKPVRVEVTILAFEPHAHIQVTTASQHIGRKIREKLARYSVEQAGEDVAEREHRELWGEIDDILLKDGLSYDRVESGEAVLTRGAIEGLMALCGKSDPIHWKNIYKLLGVNSVPRENRAFVARWLTGLFELERDPDEEIGTAIGALASREVGDDLVRLIRERRYGNRRWPLCMALARMKHPEAADVLAQVLGQGLNDRAIIEMLGEMNANWHAGRIRRFVADPEADVRSAAVKALSRMRVSIDPPPPPAHVVDARVVPKNLARWSSRLEMGQLIPTLQGLEMHIGKGFGAMEIAQVAGAAAEMRPGRSRAFRFRVTMGLRSSDLWVVLSLDEERAMGLEVHGRADLIAYFRATAGIDEAGGWG